MDFRKSTISRARARERRGLDQEIDRLRHRRNNKGAKSTKSPEQNGITSEVLN